MDESVALPRPERVGERAPADASRSLSSPAKWIVALATLVWLIALALWAVDTDALRSFAREDGFIEYLGAACYLVAGAGLMALAVARPQGKLVLGVLGLGLFGVGGEEISWGQRIFGFGTPGTLESRNVQGETSLHNIEALHGPMWWIGLLVSASVFVLWPLLRPRVGFLRSLGDRFDAPVPSLVPSAVIVGQAVVLYVLNRGFKVDQGHFLGEVAETLLASVALLFAIEAWYAHRGADLPIFPTDSSLHADVADG